MKFFSSQLKQKICGKSHLIFFNSIIYIYSYVLNDLSENFIIIYSGNFNLLVMFYLDTKFNKVQKTFEFYYFELKIY